MRDKREEESRQDLVKDHKEKDTCQLHTSSYHVLDNRIWRPYKILRRDAKFVEVWGPFLRLA